MVEAEPDDREAAPNAWIDQQMAALHGCQRSVACARRSRSALPPLLRCQP
jgi:hypothetical protein